MAHIDHQTTLTAEDPLHAGLGHVLKANLDALEGACKTYLCSHSTLADEFTEVKTGALIQYETDDISEILALVRMSPDGTPRSLVVKVDAKDTGSVFSIAMRAVGGGSLTTAAQAVDTSWTRYTFTLSDPPVMNNYGGVLGDGVMSCRLSLMAECTAAGTLYLRAFTVTES